MSNILKGMEREEKFVIKTSYDNDIRRFATPRDRVTTFQQLYSLISKLYSIDTFIIKYIDDEGDAISVTSTAELTEAFRLSAKMITSLGAPILRLNVYKTSVPPSCYINSLSPSEQLLETSDSIPPAEGPESEEEDELNIEEEEESKEYPKLDPAEWEAPKKTSEIPQPKIEIVEEIKPKEEIIIEEEAKEYPPLDISEWEPPKKKESSDLPKVTKIQTRIDLPVEEDIPELVHVPKTISQQCVSLSNNILETCLAESDSTRRSCDSISDQIRDECLLLSQQTLSDTSKYSMDIQSELDELIFSDESSSPSSSRYLCSISEEIAAQCRSLSSTIRDDVLNRSDAIRDEVNGYHSQMMESATEPYHSLLDGWQQLSESTAKECEKICENTSQLTQDLSDQVLSETSSILVNTDELKSECMKLSNETLNACQEMSNDVLRAIMAL